MQKIIKQIVLTGGPCAGKSQAIQILKQEIPKLGWTLLIVPETASELITNGIAPWTCSSNYQYHIYQMSLQQYKECIIHRAAVDLSADKILIVCDRGQIDAKSYVSADEYRKICEILSTSEDEMLHRYDAVFYLRSVAKGHPWLYTTADNAARHESIEEAAEQDDKTWKVWMNHPHIYEIKSYVDFNFKIQVFLENIKSFLQKFS